MHIHSLFTLGMNLNDYILIHNIQSITCDFLCKCKFCRRVLPLPQSFSYILLIYIGMGLSIKLPPKKQITGQIWLYTNNCYVIIRHIPDKNNNKLYFFSKICCATRQIKFVLLSFFGGNFMKWPIYYWMWSPEV